MKESVFNKKTKSSIKNLNTLENYVSKNLPDDISLGGKNMDEISPDEMKMEFLKRDVKATEVLPEKMKKSREIPDNLGYFESSFGTVSVGYKKYDKNSKIAFSFIPETVKEKERIPSKDENSPKTYFGGEKGRKKTFKASKLSFVYNPATENIEKLEKDNDGVADNEENLLYEDEQQEKEIENLKRLKQGVNPETKMKLSKKADILRQIRAEEERDNAEILEEIKTFVKKFKKDKLRKIIDSDEAISRGKRMRYSVDDLLILRNLLKKLLEEAGGDISQLKGLNINELSKEKLKEVIKELKNKVD